MPSVYIARVNNGAPIPSFVQKEIGNRMPGMVSDVHVAVHSKNAFFQPQYLFRYFVFVLMNGATAIVDKLIYFSAFANIRNLSRLFETPVFSFRFKNLSAGQIAQLKGYGLQQDKANPNIFVGAPESHLLKSIKQLGPIGDRLRPGHVTFEGYLAWVFLMKGIMVYTTTKRYSRTLGYNVYTDDATEVDKGTSGNIITMDGAETAIQNSSNGTISRATGRYMVAPPNIADIPMVGSFHDASSLPEFGDGIFFPYFNGMNTSDKTTAFETFATIFDGMLAPKHEVSQTLMMQIRTGARQLAFHRSGIAIAHIYKCMALATNIDCKMHVITKGSVYVGTVLEGDFEVSVHGVVTASGDMTEDLGKINLLEAQAVELCGLINAVEDVDKTRYQFVKEDFLTSRSCLSIFNSLNLSLFHSSNSIDKIKSTMRKMEFNDVFPVASTETVVKAVSFMLSGDKSVIQGFPAFLGGEILEKPGRVTEALSMFGPRVPSCNYGKEGGLTFAIPAPGKEDTHITRVEGVRPLQYLPFQLVPLQVGIVQWDSLISTGILRLPKGRKGRKEFTDLHSVQVSISADPTFTDVYTMIKTMVNEAREAGKASGKRKRGDGMDNAEPIWKKQKVNEEEDYL